MITVSIRNNAERRFLRLKVKGHSGQAEIGQDIVCASASILAYTVAQIVKDMEAQDSKAFVYKPIIKLESGDATVTCKCKTDIAYFEVINALNVAQVGYSLLAHNYPQYVELKH